MKLLLVDSDVNMVEMLSGWLKALGYQVHRAYTAEQAKAKWLEYQPELVILDNAALKGIDALAMCRDLRSKHDALVVIVTAGKDVDDEVFCLESGADDYLRKPFFPNQLLARIRAVGRRARSTLKLSPSLPIKVGSLCVDPLHNEVRVGGKTIQLTPTESKLLNLLATNADIVCTLDQIVTHVWGFGNAGDISLIKTHIYHLRQKIELDPSNPRYLLSVPGVGYTLTNRFPREDFDIDGKNGFHTSLSIVASR